jgi:hypothetical protein
LATNLSRWEKECLQSGKSFAIRQLRNPESRLTLSLCPATREGQAVC